MIKRSVASVLIFCLAGCTNLFFFPSKELNLPPDKYGISYKDLELTQNDGTKIRGWKLLAQGEAQGTILYFHGNAQNISYHIGGVHWLPKEGFNVILMDYQGYGPSDGSPSVKAAISDIKLTIKSFQNEARPLIVYGQSIGASLAVPALAELTSDIKVDGIVLESPFASYQKIAREKVGSFWLTWPFQYPISLFISDEYAPDRFIEKLPHAPLLMVYSEGDEVIPFHHTLDLFKNAPAPKELWKYGKERHIGIFQNDATRGRLAQYFKGIR